MKNLRIISAAALLCGLSFLAGQVVAQDGDGKDKPAMGAPPWAQLTPEHKHLQKGVGEWTAATKFWMGPGQPPEVGKGTMSTESMFGDKYTVSMFKSAYAGMPYLGHLLTGYDTVDKEFVSVWVNNFSPVPVVARGKMVDGVLTMYGDDVDFMTGKKKKTMATLSWQGDDQYTYTMYDVHGDETVKTGEIVYTRTK